MGMTATAAVGIGTGTAAGVALNIGGNLAIDGTVDGVDVSGAIATLTADLQAATTTANAHIAAVTAVHGAAAGTRFLTASETIADSQIPAGVARDVELPGNASFTLAGLLTRPFSALTDTPTDIAGYGLTDAASTTLVTAHTGAVTAVHGAAAGTRFLTASETLGIDHGGTGQTASSAALTALGGAKLAGGNSIEGNQAFDTNTLYVDAANNRVGIGTSTPQTALHVEGETTTHLLAGSGAVGRYEAYFSISASTAVPLTTFIDVPLTSDSIGSLHILCRSHNDVGEGHFFLFGTLGASETVGFDHRGKFDVVPLANTSTAGIAVYRADYGTGTAYYIQNANSASARSGYIEFIGDIDG
jgi:hypothetical protein